MSELPPLPKVEDVDLMLEIYTHSSVRINNGMTEDYGDTQRLADLGSKVFDLVITYHLYSERPFLAAEEIQRRRLDLISDAKINDWLQAYGLKEKLRIAPNDIEVLNDPKEMRIYFHSFIGALYIRNGLQSIQTWISRLIDPAIDIKLPGLPSHAEQQFQQLGPHVHGYGQQWQRYGQQSGYMSPATGQATQTTSVHPPQPSGPPPPMPGSPPVMMPSSPMNLVTLALVNQTAAQRGYHVTYPAEQTGPAHSPTWRVKCCMNGQEYGSGSGKSQKLAKEEAARMAWAAMGWGST